WVEAAGPLQLFKIQDQTAYAAATARRLKVRQVATETPTAATKPTQYGAERPYADASAPPRSAPMQLPPAPTNRYALETRPIISFGVRRCRSELAAIVQSAPWTPKIRNPKPTRYALLDVARMRCRQASMINPMRIVQVALTSLIKRSPMADPNSPPIAM